MGRLVAEDAGATLSLRGAVLDRLARREHSRFELRNKLQMKFAPRAAELDELLTRLEAEGLLSDVRFATAFTAARARRGQGPVRIAGELRARGVAPEVIQSALADCGVDWQALALRLARERGAVGDAKSRARTARFLHQRGFTGEQIRTAMMG